MLFNSLSYAIFFPLVVILYFTLPIKMKNMLLLIASFFFYMCWNASYALLMLTSITITYMSGILIEKENRVFMRKTWVAVSFILNLSILFFFKYFNFVVDTYLQFIAFVSHTPNTFTPLNVLLPVGISFYTFQALGYTMDVYRKQLPAQKNFFTYALFISFFPQLVAGPIERAPNLMSQFDTLHKFDYVEAKKGALLIAWGLFKKMIIADRLAIITNTVYNDVYNYKGFVLIFATVTFAFQIYCDFSAYSDIARGSSKILGFNLMTNFDAPYFSKSIAEFWRRWHISLSTWFRDYLYFPLGGNKKGKKRKLINLLIVFFVSGIWHGAGLTFIAWGLLNGFYQVFGEITYKYRKQFRKLLHINDESAMYKSFQILMTFSLTCLAWVFFRSNHINDSVYILKNIIYPNFNIFTDGALLNLGLDKAEMIVATVSVCILLIVDKFSLNFDFSGFILKKPSFFRFVFYIFIIFSIMIFGVYGSNYEAVNFLYFQF